ncbi:MAG: hypothetical protein ACLFMZ_09450 [Spirochaetaceae bacterium]
MAKVSEEAKRRYNERIREHKASVENILTQEKSYLNIIENDEKGAPYKRLTLANEMLNMVSYYILMNELSIDLLGIKNETFLNDARKAVYKSIIYAEEVVTDYIDVPFSEYEEKLTEIEAFEEQKRWEFLSKLGFSIDSIKESFGDNSKWRWSFIEMHARFAVVAKNFLDMKSFLANMDPQVAGYRIRMDHMNMVQRMLEEAAHNYRQKYELSTGRIDDFKSAIRYLSALRRIYILLGESEKSDVIKKKMDVWKSKMEADSKNAESARKKSGR